MDSSIHNHTYSSILYEIRTLAREVTQRVDALHRHMPEKHHGKKYKATIVPFVQHINKLDILYNARIQRAAGQIAQISGEGWQNNKDVVHLWHQVALVVEKFSEHPTKKVAALIISKDGHLQSYSANAIPFGIRKKANYYLEGLRKKFILCAERMALAKFYELSVDRYKGLSAESRVRLLSDTVAEIGKHSQELRESYMLSTVVPCHECRPAIIASRPRGILVDTNTGKRFKRSNGFDETLSSFANNGIMLYKLAA